MRSNLWLPWHSEFMCGVLCRWEISACMHRYRTLWAWQLAHRFSDSSCWCGYAHWQIVSQFAFQFCHSFGQLVSAFGQEILPSSLLHCAHGGDTWLFKLWPLTDAQIWWVKFYDMARVYAWCIDRAGLHRPLIGDVGRPCDMSDIQWQDLEGDGIFYHLFAS